MPPIDQFRPFQERLSDFGPELGSFIGRVWRERDHINLRDFNTGVGDIYALYSGVERAQRYNEKRLISFIRGLRTAARGYPIHSQHFGRALSEFNDAAILVNGLNFWTDFFHVLSSPSPAKTIRNRIYIHATNAAASIGLMGVIIGQFRTNRGLWEAKTAGPGSMRLDTIVCYLYDLESADALVQKLSITSAAFFLDSLPPLVKRVARGIGVADEPPAIEIYKRGGARHSYGSFFSTLCWVALKTTPNIGTPNADGRHMLDNMLYSLRTLRVDPRNPQRFPDVGLLEAWYQAALR